jgi:hypothetical protein
MWICPECGRKFTRNNQSHSCIDYNIEDFFFGKSDDVRKLFNTLIERVLEFGEVQIRAGKWGITGRRLSTFLTVMIKKNHLTVIFLSEVPIDEFPVYQNYHHSGNRFSNSIKIESAEEIDEQLLGWLKQAWELAI